jgi:hypothetical protein
VVSIASRGYSEGLGTPCIGGQCCMVLMQHGQQAGITHAGDGTMIVRSVSSYSHTVCSSLAGHSIGVGLLSSLLDGEYDFRNT